MARAFWLGASLGWVRAEGAARAEHSVFVDIPPMDDHEEHDARREMDLGQRVEAWLESYRDALRGAVARVRSGAFPIEVDEVEQEVRIRLWKALRSERKIEQPRSYLYRMALNATLDVVRRRDRRLETSIEEIGRGTAEEKGFDPPAPAASPEALTRRRLLLAAVGQCLEQLPGERGFCVRCHLQGFTTRETAAVRGWSEARARNLTYRGLAQLRRLLAVQGIKYERDD